MEITREQLFNFVKQRELEEYQDTSTWLSSTSYYVRVWDTYHNRSWFLSWNWGPLWGPYWFLYRKMHLFAFLYCGLYFIFLSITIYLHPTSDYLSLTMFLQNPRNDLTSYAFWSDLLRIFVRASFTFIPPLIANSLYLNYAKKCISQGKRRSGTSLHSAVLGMAAYLGIIIYLFMF